MVVVTWLLVFAGGARAFSNPSVPCARRALPRLAAIDVSPERRNLRGVFGRVAAPTARVASACTAAFRVDPISQVVALVTAMSSFLASRSPLFVASGYVCIVVFLAFVPIQDALTRVVFAAFSALGLELVTQPTKAEDPKLPPKDSVDPPVEPSVAPPPPKAVVKETPKVDPEDPSPKAMVPEAAPPPPAPKVVAPPPPIPEPIVVEPVVVPVPPPPRSKRVSNKDLLGTWRFNDGNEVELARDGRANTSPTFSSRTTWRLKGDDLEIDLECPKTLPSGAFGGSTPVQVSGKVTNYTFRGTRRSAVLGFYSEDEVTMTRVATPTLTERVSVSE